jgi:hypothetical protein
MAKDGRWHRRLGPPKVRAVYSFVVIKDTKMVLLLFSPWILLIYGINNIFLKIYPLAASFSV